jgi:5'-nucleotidase / UDP-sugar diphosphatase
MRFCTPLLAAILLLGCSKEGNPGSGGGTGGATTASTTTTPTDGKQRLTILHTNDWQSHMLGFGPNTEYTPGSTDDDGTVGGLARAATLVSDIRTNSTHPVVLYDAGDFMAGALFQLLATSHAAELQVAQAMGYDAMTLGNHEFDWGPGVLGEMIATGDAAGVTVPILAANTVPDASDPADDALEAHFTSGRITATRVQTLDNGLTLGLFGLVGDSAGALAPAAVPTVFSEANVAAEAAVAQLQGEGVDLVIALTHNGVHETDPLLSPDHDLAQTVPGIDVIVGGHSHVALPEPLVADDGTVIVQAGAHTQYVGQLDLAYDGTTWEVENYTLHELDDTIPGDPTVIDLIDGFRAALDAGPLQEIGYGFNEAVASVPAPLILDECGETTVGNLVTDAFFATMNASNPADPIVVAFESQGVIRQGMSAGQSSIQGFSDVFNVLPLGGGIDEVPGYVLVDFYVNAQELQTVCEVTGSVSEFFGCNYFIEASGLRCNFDMNQQLFNRTIGVDLWNGTAYEPLDTSTSNLELYHVAVDSYVASLIFLLEELTSGLMKATPKYADGTVVLDQSTVIFDSDPDTDGVQDIKLWDALVSYMASFEDTDGDGIADLPERYSTPDGRIVGMD